MQKGPLPKEMHALHAERIRAGQARAQAAGKRLGTPLRYSDAAIWEAMRMHETGRTWVAIAASLGISEPRLYARVRQLRSAAQHAD